MICRLIQQPITLNTLIQTSSVLIQLNGHEVLVSAVYKPPGATLTSHDLDWLTQSAEWQISAGDFNAKHPLWYSHSTNAAGRVLFDHVQQSDYTITAPSSPTHFPTNARYRPDILDIALVRLPYPTQIDNLNELSSDHNPILLETLCTPVSSSPPTTNRFINWTKYKTILSNLPNPTERPTTNSESIDLAIDTLTKNIQHAIEASVFTPKHKNSSFLLPDYIKLVITVKTSYAVNGK
ncbi:unnamed protein product [Macrosiphum euphorbiae]|uniref:Endonuclease/exonuclease/phosphatase domain-containing protein n=1 Tax=Macrosiphum euphorbiae TaxID=13131 RepID=A0AAV0XKG9_9HEMI|nr:unnamed protein product [Macrosiphum euphorbiae]